MKKLILTALVGYALAVPALAQDSKNFLYLFSDSIIYAQKVQLRPDFSGYWQFRADSRRVPISQVKFFNNEDGFFANTRRFSLAGESQFSERIVAGKINLFQERPYDPEAFHRPYHYGMERDRLQIAALSMYYNKGFGDLKRVRYRNLMKDMADHPQSMQFLKDYRKSSQLSKIISVTAGAAIIAGVATLLTGGYSESSFTNSSILMGGGIVLATGGYLIHLSGKKNIEKAITNYNK
ncbi:hypothetical protein [Pedobacter gandavensis]|uniref:hypothetical protein n=1 Tax=Pedobacter gandavensis TaxID=2679963 RepID=UPI00292CE171|nr:hypothetical protein [Pedobacter gandavensis]